MFGKNNQFLTFFLGLIFALIPLISKGQSLQSQTLTLNQPIERSIKGGETQTFQFEVKAGNYARVEVEQKNIDVIVSLFSSDGKSIIEMNGRTVWLWRESVSSIALIDETYRLEVKAYSAVSKEGSYSVKLVELRQSNPNDSQWLKAEQHLSKGRKFYEQSQWDKAAPEFEKAARLWHELNDFEWEAVALVNLGTVNRIFKNYEAALVIYQQATKFFQKTKDLIGQNNAREGQAYALQYLGLTSTNYGKAKEYYEQSLVIYREIKDRLGESIILGNLGYIYFDLANYEKAKDYYEQNLIIVREGKSRGAIGLTVNNLGSIYYQLANYEKAKEYYEQVLVIYREIKFLYGEASVLNNLGNIYFRLANYEKAKDYYEESLLLSRKNKDSSGEATSLNNLGNIYAKLANYKKAKEYYEESLTLRLQFKDQRKKVDSYLNLMELSIELKNPQIAIIYGKQAKQDVISNTVFRNP